MGESVPSAVPFPVPDYELLRPIGRGSYGEVWLARSLLGELRAVKIVRRDGHHDERPFEREFAGLQKFEPLSRGHPGLVHVLHVGRFEGGFFYVMELADPEEPIRVGSSVSNGQPAAAAGTAPAEPRSELSRLETYRPHTLRSDQRLHGRLPIADCLRIALKLTDALAYLHGHGLVHRDIKPSNIIVVRGEPKLADIGLVASTDASMSCVGTEGYLAPEGPGKPPADLYALGKVLYEISTGRDRTDFPELPTLLREDPERAAMEELNEVVLRACEPELRRRYQTAAEMRAELELLAAGRSLQQARRRERNWARARTFGIAASVVVALLVLLKPWWRRTEVSSSSLPEVLAVDGASFWRGPYMARQFDFSLDGERIVFAGTNRISIWERGTRITRHLEIPKLGEWMVAGVRGAVGMPRLAPDGRHFVFQGYRQIGGTLNDPLLVFSFVLVDALTADPQIIGAEMAEADRAEDVRWRPDGRSLTYRKRHGQLVTLSISGERTHWKESELGGARPNGLGDYSPDGEWLLITSGDSYVPAPADRDIWAVRHLGGVAHRLTQTSGDEICPTWSPDGGKVYFVAANDQQDGASWGIWAVAVDKKTWKARDAPREAVGRMGSKLLHPKFVSDGRVLAYAVATPRTDVWISRSEEMQQGTLTIRGQAPLPSPDGEKIYFVGERPDQRGIYVLNRNGDPASLRRVTELKPPPGTLSLSPDGEWLALFADDGHRRGLFVVSSHGGEPRFVQSLSRKFSVYPAWSPDGKWLAYSAGAELVRWMLASGEREVLAHFPFWHPWSTRWSPDGGLIAGLVSPDDRPNTEECDVHVLALADKSQRQLTTQAENQWKEGLEWHPDGHSLTYMLYGPKPKEAQIRRAWIDGRPTDLMIQQTNHWDYVGVWAPQGRHFYFVTSDTLSHGVMIDRYDAETRQVTHDILPQRGASLPRWSKNGQTAAWTTSMPQRFFERLERASW